MCICWATAELENSLRAEAALIGLSKRAVNGETIQKPLQRSQNVRAGCVFPSEQLDRIIHSFSLNVFQPTVSSGKRNSRFLSVTFLQFCVFFNLPGDDAMTGDTDKYLAPQDLRELGDDSLPQEGYMGFSVGARSQR